MNHKDDKVLATAQPHQSGKGQAAEKGGGQSKSAVQTPTTVRWSVAGYDLNHVLAVVGILFAAVGIVVTIVFSISPDIVHNVSRENGHVEPITQHDTALVKSIQQQLLRVGYAVDVDGDYGPRTEESIKGYQHHHNQRNLTECDDLDVDGIPSRPLLECLKKSPTYTEISAATDGYHSCALKFSGDAVCWGWNKHGQVIPSDKGAFERITDDMHILDGFIATITPEMPFQSISAGLGHTCAISGGRVVCWGTNSRRQTEYPTSGGFTSISAGAYHSCALKDSGDAYCWGYDHGRDGNIRYGQNVDRRGPFTSISAGYYHNCALKPDGEADCWGRLKEGQAEPPRGDSGRLFQSISAGWKHTCALVQESDKKDPGKAICWGEKNQATIHQSGPFQSISAGLLHTCALLKPSGQAICWGYNNYGQTNAPSGYFQSISAGREHTCALRKEGDGRETYPGDAVCWGRDTSGQATPP